MGRGRATRARWCSRPIHPTPSRVTFELEPHGELVKLTVLHDHFEPDSVVAQMVSKGWPLVVSSLKTLLETGETHPAAA
jgi:Activator of Hsp90 ATPase homolog 1-like protein